MSIKDRIKFFQNLKKNQDPKPQPKPLPSKLPEGKPEFLKPVTDQFIKPIHVEPKQPVSLHENSKPTTTQTQSKSTIYEVLSNKNHAQQTHPNDLPIKQPPPKPLQITKSAQVISQPQLQKQLNSQNKNPQTTEQKEQPSTINFKNLRNMFETKDFPIIQQPSVMKSCFVPKKLLVETHNQADGNNQAPKPKQERTSLPQKTDSSEGEKKLSFQEMRLIAEGLLSKAKAPPIKPHHQEQQQAHQHQQKQQQQQPQPTTTQQISQHQSLPVDEKQNNPNTESDILFKQALGHQPSDRSNTLVTGQSNHLNLATRKTMARRRNNDDDFDDL